MSPLKLIRFALAIVLLNAATARAQEEGVDPNQELKLSTYEVGDLVVTVPDYGPQTGKTNAAPSPGAYSGGMGGGGLAGMMMGSPAGAQGAIPDSGVSPVTMPGLIDAIRTMVAPRTWQGAAGAGMDPATGIMGPEGMGMPGGEMGAFDPTTGQPVSGGQGQITHLGSTLIIRQTKEVHREVALLLESLRGGSAMRRTISIDARWLLLSSDDLERLTPASDDVAQQPAVDRKALAEFTRRPTSLRGITNCFSGQAVYLISGTLRSSVSSYIPVVGSLEPTPAPWSERLAATQRGARASAPPQIQFAAHRTDETSAPGLITLIADDRLGLANDRSVGYQPVITTNNFGVQIELRPTLLQGEQAAIVDLKSVVNFPGSPAPVDPAAMPGAALAPSVDRVAIQSQELATTLRLPLGQPVLVGGMTYLAAAGDTFVPGALPDPVDSQEGGEQRQLYLVLEIK